MNYWHGKRWDLAYRTKWAKEHNFEIDENGTLTKKPSERHRNQA